MSEMKLIGSRNLGINYENSDYDYAVLEDDLSGGTFSHIINDHFKEHHHCYHYNKEYRLKVARFEIEDENDYQFVYNAEDFKAGLFNISPFEHKAKWIEKLKSIDFYCKYWYSQINRKFRKRFYHIVYNLECLKNNSIEINADSLEKVSRFHNMEATEKDYQDVISEIQNL